MPKWWGNPSETEWISSRSPASVGSSSSFSSNSSRAWRKEETPLSPPPPLLIHHGHPHRGQERLDRREEEGRSPRSRLRGISISNSIISSVEPPLICQVFTLNIYDNTWYMLMIYMIVDLCVLNVYIPSKILFIQKTKASGLPAVNHMQVGRVTILTKGNSTATLRRSLLWHQYSSHLHSLI